jgi:hypothetical protein
MEVSYVLNSLNGDVMGVSCKVLGFVLEKNSVQTELDEFREISDEFRIQFGEISECKA